MVVGDDPLTSLPRPVARALTKSKIVYVGPLGGVTDKRADVSIHTTDLIIQGSESMTRLDQVEVGFKPWKGVGKSIATSDGFQEHPGSGTQAFNCVVLKSTRDLRAL